MITPAQTASELRQAASRCSWITRKSAFIWRCCFASVAHLGYLPEEFLAVVERYWENPRWTGPLRELREPVDASQTQND